jgi:hypothetical protein
LISRFAGYIGKRTNQTHDQDDRRTLNASITSLRKALVIIEAQAVKEMATAKFISKKLTKISK